MVRVDLSTTRRVTSDWLLSCSLSSFPREGALYLVLLVQSWKADTLVLMFSPRGLALPEARFLFSICNLTDNLHFSLCASSVSEPILLTNHSVSAPTSMSAILDCAYPIRRIRS